MQKFSIGQTVYIVIEGKRHECTVVSYFQPLNLYDLEVFYQGRKQIITVRSGDIKAA